MATVLADNETPLLDNDTAVDSEPTPAGNDVSAVVSEPTNVVDKELPKWGKGETCCGGEAVPAFAYNEEIGRLWKQNGYVAMTCVSGPGFLLARRWLIVLWVFLFVFPIFAAFMTHCPDEDESGESGGAAVYNELVLQIVFALGVFPVLYYGWKCSTYTLLTQVGTIGPFWLVHRFPYFVWLAVCQLLSIGNLLDNLTNALFVAKIWVTTECECYKAINDTWHDVLQKSTLRHIPLVADADFCHLVVFVYAMTFLQPIWALIETTPFRAKKKPTYAVGVGQGYVFGWPSLTNNDMNPGAALQIVAQASRLESVTQKDFAFAEARIDNWETKKGPQWQVNLLNQASIQVGRKFIQFILVGFLQNALTVNLQISFFALIKRTAGVTDYQVLLSIIITILAMLGDFPDMVDMMQMARKSLKKVGHIQTIQRHDYLREFGDTQGTRKDLEAKITHIRNTIKLRLVVAACTGVLYFFAVVLALMKVIGLFVCPKKTNLFNINGCA